MGRFFKIILLILLFIPQSVYAQDDMQEIKQQITVLYNTNKLKEAYQLISKIPEDKRDSEIWLLAANITQDYGRELDTVFLLQKALSLDETNYKIYYNLGVIYLKDNKINSAINNFKLALKYNKEFPYAWYNLGCAYLVIFDYKKAKNAFMRAISFNTTEPDFYYNLAYTYKMLGNKKQSEKMLEIYNTLISQNN